MKKTIITAFLAGLGMLVLGGCATPNKGSTQTVLIQTTPYGASVFINGEQLPKPTPVYVELARGNSYAIDLKKEGYEVVTAVVLPVPNSYEGNLFRWGVDYQTGAMTDLTPREINVELKRASKKQETAKK